MLIINPATWEQLVYEEQSNKTGVQIIATIPPRFMGIKVLRSLDVKENDLYYVGEGAEVNLAQFGI